MGRARTRKLSKKEMDVWVSGYNNGLKAGLAAMTRGLKAIKREAQINKKDQKDIARKFR